MASDVRCVDGLGGGASQSLGSLWGGVIDRDESAWVCIAASVREPISRTTQANKWRLMISVSDREGRLQPVAHSVSIQQLYTSSILQINFSPSGQDFTQFFAAKNPSQFDISGTSSSSLEVLFVLLGEVELIPIPSLSKGKMRASSVLVCTVLVCALLASVTAEPEDEIVKTSAVFSTYAIPEPLGATFAETFSGDWSSRWVTSKHSKFMEGRLAAG